MDQNPTRTNALTVICHYIFTRHTFAINNQGLWGKDSLITFFLFFWFNLYYLYETKSSGH